MPRFLLSVFFWVLAFFSSAQAQQSADTKEVERETFSLINQYRKANDLPLLAWDGEIARVARIHSKEMATGDVNFGHDGFRERASHLRNLMPGFWGAGENVLKTSNPEALAQNAVTLWLHSPHHLENIRGDYIYSGLGVWRDKDGVIYFTQIFVKIKPQAQETETAAPSVNTPFGMLATPDPRAGR